MYAAAAASHRAASEENAATAATASPTTSTTNERNNKKKKPPPNPNPTVFRVPCDGPSCHRTNVTLMCGRCHNAFYCSAACQRRHWRGGGQHPGLGLRSPPSAGGGGHQHSCLPFDAPLTSLLRRTPDDGAWERFPRPTDPCLARGGCQGGGTLEFPFYFSSCGMHWVCADCAAHAALSNPLQPRCPQCQEPYRRATAGPGTTAGAEDVLAELSCAHIAAGGWYLQDVRLCRAEKASVSRRLLAAHARVKERTHPTLARRPSSDPLFADMEVFMRASIMLAGMDPGALEYIQKAGASLRDKFVAMCDHALREIGTSARRSEERAAVLKARADLQMSGVTCQMFAGGNDLLQMIFGDGPLGLATSYRVVLADALADLERWDDALTVYRDLTHSDARTQALLGMSKCLLKLGKAPEAVVAAESTLASVGDNRHDIENGVHKTLADAQAAAGKDAEARRTMERALLYESPWIEPNLVENLAYIEELTLPKAERKRRAREKAFTEVWADSLDLVGQTRARGLVSWSSIKWKEYDMFADDEKDDDVDDKERLLAETATRLESAVSAAIRADDEDIVFVDPDIEDDNCIIDRVGTKSFVDLDNVSALVFDRFKLTKEVRKWWMQGDNKFKDFFVRRIRQLAAGDRSRILRKRLTGSKNTTIFETYLEQKSGFRILWTEAADGSDDRSGIIIWYVSPHDLVSRYMRRIDEAETRSIRQLTAVSAVPDLMSAVTGATASMGAEVANDLRHDEVKLDPFADTPLKLYALRYDDLNRMAASTWLPPLHLTTEEREIVETEETVLLLGRSGTGKTVCICNRIDFDRHLAEGDPTFSQLFVARSQRICSSVADTIGSFGALDDNGSSLVSYMTFRKLLDDCEVRLSDDTDSPGYSSQHASRIDYVRFRSFMDQMDCELEPLIVWTQVRSFIKGSIEAVMKGRPLTLEEYLDTAVIGSRRCRLTKEMREVAYVAYEKYERYRTSRNLWDDCDRVGALVTRLCADRPARERVARRRVYVDEIQDYSQVEIALFFLICDSGGLFLAGDPAQSVVEGIEFRFEEVRSVAYHLYSNDSKSHRYIPRKPMSVTRNFRSHAGILNVAAEVLDKMFVAFPGSAKELPKDEGLFRGPRPTVFQGVGQDVVLELISKVQGIVLLSMHDDHVDELKRLETMALHGTVVLSIRDAKGLEFPDVMLVDFFRLLPPEQQKPWRLLLQGKLTEATRHPGFPEVETQLKQLYTAITRCSRRLFFVETAPSDAGQAFVRYFCSDKKLAIKQEAEDVQESIKAVDEWGTTGVQYAVNAEASESDETSLYWLDRALYCFRQGKVKELEQKAQLHIDSIRLRMEHSQRTRSSIDNDDELEKRASEHLTQLATEGLLREAALFVSVIKTLLTDFTREALEARLVPLLPNLDEY